MLSVANRYQYRCITSTASAPFQRRWLSTWLSNTIGPAVSGADLRYFLMLFGAGDVTRTRDLLITNQLLYQLSYAGQARNKHSTTAVRLKPE